MLCCGYFMLVDMSSSIIVGLWIVLIVSVCFYFFFFFQAEDGIRDKLVTGVQTCALPIYAGAGALEQGVGGDRGAVNEHGDGAGICIQGAEHPDRGILRRRHHLPHRNRAVLAKRDEIGEGAADVDADPHPSTTPMRNGECEMRSVSPQLRTATLTLVHDQGPINSAFRISALHTFRAGAPTAICRPRARRRTRWSPAPPAAPPNPRGARTAGSRRWCAADRPRSLRFRAGSRRTFGPRDR